MAEMDVTMTIKVDTTEVDEAIKKLEKLNKLQNSDMVKVSLERTD